MKKIGKAILCLLIATTSIASAQTYNVIPVAVPSLQIAPDARGAGMGDIGAATTPDVYSQHWNPAKFPFTQSRGGGFAFSYTPWLRSLVNDMHLMYATGYGRFGHDGRSAVSFSIRHFSLGEVDVTHDDGTFWQTVSPFEFAIDIAYSRRLTETFSGAIAVRYIFADYSLGDDRTTPGNAFAIDLAGFNQSNVRIGRTEALLGLGFNISNIGTKISYDGGATSMFLPTNLRLGSSLGFQLNAKNNLSLNLDLNKLLVPTPPLPIPPTVDETPAETQQRLEENRRRFERHNNISSIAGIFRSFGDAPGGLREELQEISWSFGTEYIFNELFSLRAGYHHESRWKGNRSFVALGAGFSQGNYFRIDVAYLIATNRSNPLDQTLRFSLGVGLDAVRRLIY
jgi:hypothetical protein